MIKRFIQGKKPAAKERRIGGDQYGIQLSMMSPLAVHVVDTLLDAGYEAYIVGGCIRDALMGKTPKDFDVATSATPEQVKRLFRRSRIIGRRFKIVHVQDRREVIEVTTFRGSHKGENGKHASQSNQGVLLRDNVYGTLQEDALRRDFTCNSLYYDIDSNEIVDFLDGCKDLKKKVLRTIGDPAERFKEDPVRMMRALRFQAKLDIKLDSASSKQLKKQIGMIREVSAARMFDEIIKLLMHTESSRAFQLMDESGLFGELFPASAKLTQRAAKNKTAALPNYKKLIEIAMRNTEKRLRTEQRVSPFYLYASLLWPAVDQEYRQLLEAGTTPSQAMDMAAGKIIEMHGSIVSIAKRFSIPVRDTWYLQTQLHRRAGNRAQRLFEHARFRAAYDFLLMREEAGEELEGLGTWWSDYQAANEQEREKMAHALSKDKKQPGNRKSRSRRRPRKRSPEQSSPAAD